MPNHISDVPLVVESPKFTRVERASIVMESCRYYENAFKSDSIDFDPGLPRGRVRPWPILPHGPF
jgi:hypothetical protein